MVFEGVRRLDRAVTWSAAVTSILSSKQIPATILGEVIEALQAAQTPRQPFEYLVRRRVIPTVDSIGLPVRMLRQRYAGNERKVTETRHAQPSA